MKLSDAFTHTAKRYDQLTRLNPGYHRELRAAARALAEELELSRDRQPGQVQTGAEQVAPARIWDLGCGSGLSTQALLAALPTANITGVDAAEGMLAQARTKTWPDTVEFVHERAENLPNTTHPRLVEQPDAVFAAYLIRNVPDAQRTEVLTAIGHRLAPGAPIVLQEYSVADSAWARVRWTAVCWAIIIPLSVIFRAGPGLYVYLWRSVRDNDSIPQLGRRLKSAGFTDIKTRTGRGWHRGILHTVVAEKASS